MPTFGTLALQINVPFHSLREHDLSKALRSLTVKRNRIPYVASLPHTVVLDAELRGLLR